MKQNIIEFASELSTIIDQQIRVEHIHAISNGRYYYIQSPEVGAPMLLHHYRGPFFIDIHPDDLKKIETGEISPHDYIYTSNWLVGYFWGGGSMINGGYYQPMDIVNRKDDVQRYLKILSCRGSYRSSCYLPTEEHCNACPVKNCPFSKYKYGTWKNEMSEYDPRVELFNALSRRFENQYHGYQLRGFLCTESEDDTITLFPNCHYSEEEPFSFLAYASENIIRDLLMNKVTPDNWDEYVKHFEFRIHNMFTHTDLDVNEENIKSIFAEVDYVTTKPNFKNIRELLANNEDGSIIAKIYQFFKNIF